MGELLKDSLFNHWLENIETWISQHVLSWENLFQVVTIVFLILVGFLSGKAAKRVLRERIATWKINNSILNRFLKRSIRLTSFVFSVLLLGIAIQVFSNAGLSFFLVTLVLNLMMAWVLVELATSVIIDRFWARFVSILVWVFAALNILGLFEPVITLLSETGFTIGKTRLSVLSLLQAIIIFAVLLKAASWLNNYFEQKLDGIPGINSSTRLIMSKVTHVAMIMLAGIVVLNTVGIDFSSLAIFSGAIGVGVGFGLQKVVANYISGLILLSDKSVKPGDVIQLADAFGWVRFMGGRYISVVTRDEKEYLIPNEDLITQQVINWSYSNNKIRQKIGFGVSYKSDPHQIIDLVTKIVEGTDRVLSDPKPVCLLTGFGDSSVDFELRYWITDPEYGITNINSIILLKIWDAFKAHNIEIPFPQRDVHLK